MKLFYVLILYVFYMMCGIIVVPNLLYKFLVKFNILHLFLFYSKYFYRIFIILFVYEFLFLIFHSIWEYLNVFLQKNISISNVIFCEDSQQQITADQVQQPSESNNIQQNHREVDWNIVKEQLESEILELTVERDGLADRRRSDMSIILNKSIGVRQMQYELEDVIIHYQRREKLINHTISVLQSQIDNIHFDLPNIPTNNSVVNNTSQNNSQNS